MVISVPIEFCSQSGPNGFFVFVGGGGSHKCLCTSQYPLNSCLIRYVGQLNETRATRSDLPWASEKSRSVAASTILSISFCVTPCPAPTSSSRQSGVVPSQHVADSPGSHKEGRKPRSLACQLKGRGQRCDRPSWWPSAETMIGRYQEGSRAANSQVDFTCGCAEPRENQCNSRHPLWCPG